MSARVRALEADGLLEPGQRVEEVVVIRGRKPAREPWRLPTEDELTAA
jgi:hypothetical protein